ncbi:putative caspase-like protein [Bradyrhizobium sp. AZCC 2262]
MVTGIWSDAGYLRHERLKLQHSMHGLLKTLLAVLAIFANVSAATAGAAPSEKRLALVIGNASYKAKPLATAVNDAALIAQTLRAAGFDVMGARDLDEDLLRQTFRDFVDAVRSAGPGAVAAVYFAGYGLQLEGENYLLPIDADITDASDVSLRAVRLSEQSLALAALDLKASFMILDMARANPFVLSGQPPASGLAWVEPETNMLIAFNAAPGTVSPDSGNGYGPYAKALSEMIREGGRTPADLFDRVRLRVNELTKGAQVPWDTSDIEAQFMFFERGPDAPSRADSPERTARMRSQPMGSLGAQDAYMAALMRDTFDGYADFLADYWRDPMTKRIRALLAARREAITWRRTGQANVPDAYWSYLSRYPAGAHVDDARRRLVHLGATIAPPSKFAMIDYDVPPPLPDELEFVERTVLLFNDPAFAFESPPPSPAYFLEPPPPELLALAPPDAPSEAYVLPAPRFVSLPSYVDVPAYVVAPPNSPVFNSVEKAPLRNAIDLPTGANGQAKASAILPSSAGNLMDSPRLPSSVATKAASVSGRWRPQLTASKPPAREAIKVLTKPAVAELASTPLWAIYKPPARKEISTIGAPTDLWATYYPMAWEAIKAPPSLRKPWPIDNRTLANTPIASSALTTDDEVPVPVTTTLAPSQRAATLSATGSIPLPLSRPTTSAPRPTRKPQTPIARAASSPIEVGHAQQPAALPNRVAPSNRVVRRPNVELGVSPPKP